MSLYLLGDSNLVRLVKSKAFDQVFRGIEVINLAQSGASVEIALNNFVAYLDTSRAQINSTRDLLLVLVGTNDLKRNIEFERSTYLRITTIGRKLFHQVYLCKIPPIPRHPGRAPLISRVNRWINSFHSVRNIQVLDLLTAFPDITDDVYDKYFEKYFHNGRIDLIHFNRLGHKKLSDFFYAVILKDN